MDPFRVYLKIITISYIILRYFEHKKRLIETNEKLGDEIVKTFHPDVVIWNSSDFLNDKVFDLCSRYESYQHFHYDYIMDWSTHTWVQGRGRGSPLTTFIYPERNI